MSWGSDSDLERRARVDNPNTADRSAAQSELLGRRQEHNVHIARELMRERGENPDAGSIPPFLEKRLRYVSFFVIGVIVVSILLEPAEFQRALSQNSDDTLALSSLWIMTTVGMWLMMFISLTIINRGSERLLVRLRKRFIFSIGFAVVVSSLVAVRIAMI